MEYDNEWQEKFLNDLWDIFENIPEEDSVYFASNLIDIAASSGGRNHLESMGLLQCAILDYQKEFEEMIEEERKNRLAKSN